MRWVGGLSSPEACVEHHLAHFSKSSYWLYAHFEHDLANLHSPILDAADSTPQPQVMMRAQDIP